MKWEKNGGKTMLTISIPFMTLMLILLKFDEVHPDSDFKLQQSSIKFFVNVKLCAEIEVKSQEPILFST